MTSDEVYALLEQVFEWDRMKAARNATKHGIRFPETATVFFDPDAVFQPDPDHSEDQQRYILLGQSIRTN